jgi:hypothetical protein
MSTSWPSIYNTAILHLLNFNLFACTFTLFELFLPILQSLANFILLKLKETTNLKGSNVHECHIPAFRIDLCSLTTCNTTITITTAKACLRLYILLDV